MKIKDKIILWNIDIRGLDALNRAIVGVRAGIAAESIDDANFPIAESEFKVAWKKLMDKAEEELK